MDQIPETPFHEEYETIECLQALEPLDSKYRLVVILYCNNMLGCDIDFIIKDLDNKSRSVVASRKDAMRLKRDRLFTFHWMKIQGRMAAVLAVGFIFCATNPVMAKNIPVVGGLFEILEGQS